MKKIAYLVLALLLCCSVLSTDAPSLAAAGNEIQVAFGDSHAMILDAGGSLWVWGDNSFGQLGTGKQTINGTWEDDTMYQILEDHDEQSPIKLLSNIVAIAAGYDFSMALNSQGELFTWGNNDQGQLGNGTTTGVLTPTKIMDNVRAIDAYASAALAITKDNAVWIWGATATEINWGGASEGLDYGYLTTPTKFIENIKKAQVGDRSLFFLDFSGDFYGVGRITYLGVPYSVITSEDIYGVNQIIHEPMLLMEGLTDFACSGQQIFALTNTAQLYGWGANGTTGLVGSDSNSFWIYVPELISNDVKQVIRGGMLIKSDDSLWVWGDIVSTIAFRIFRDGQSLNVGGSVLDTIMEYGNKPLKLLDNIQTATGNNWSRMAVDSDGQLYTWGSNQDGLLGNGKKTIVEVEVIISPDEEYAQEIYHILQDNNVLQPTIVFSLSANEDLPLTSDESIVLQIGSTEIFQGEQLLPPPPVPPQIINDRTMLPFRYLVQTLLGGRVDYDADLRRITAEVAGHEFIMVIDQMQIEIDGVGYDFGQAPMVIDGSTLVPLRAFELVVSELTWDNTTQRVIIRP